MPLSLSRDELRRQMRESFQAPQAVADNRDQSRHVTIDAPVFQVNSQTGDPVEISDALYEQLSERIRRDIRHDQEQIADRTFADPDPTLLF